MKKSISGLVWATLVLSVFYPVGCAAVACFGCILTVPSIAVYAFVTAFLSVCTVIIGFFVKEKSVSKSAMAVSAVLPPFSLICAVFCLIKCSTAFVAVCCLVSVVCSVTLAIRYGGPLILKTVSLVLTALLIIPAGSIMTVVLLFGKLSANTVVRTVESPSGQYYVEVIDSDQGALGGDTRVELYERVLDLGVFKIQKKPRRLYTGHYGEYSDMEIYWKDDSFVVINSVGYDVDFTYQGKAFEQD